MCVLTLGDSKVRREMRNVRWETDGGVMEGWWKGDVAGGGEEREGEEEEEEDEDEEGGASWSKTKEQLVVEKERWGKSKWGKTSWSQW